MTYKVFGVTLSLTQSINQCYKLLHSLTYDLERKLPVTWELVIRFWWCFVLCRNVSWLVVCELVLCVWQAYKHDSTNISVIEWLGAYYTESKLFEKAIPYFERATVIQSVNIALLTHTHTHTQLRAHSRQNAGLWPANWPCSILGL